MAADAEITVGDVTYRADASGGLSEVVPEVTSGEEHPEIG